MRSGLSLFTRNVLDAATPVGFADAGDARVGLDFDEVPVPGAAHDHALHVGDFHLAADLGGEAGEGSGGEGGARKLRLFIWVILRRTAGIIRK